MDYRKKPDPKRQLKEAAKASMPAKRHKYGVSPKEERTADGIVFDSKKEMERWLVLKRLEKAGVIMNLRRQVKFPYQLQAAHIGQSFIAPVKVGRERCYVSDFHYRDCKTETWHIEDVKGFRTREYKAKKKIVEALYGIKIEEV